jgi:hypothetical protein
MSLQLAGGIEIMNPAASAATEGDGMVSLKHHEGLPRIPLEECGSQAQF